MDNWNLEGKGRGTVTMAYGGRLLFVYFFNGDIFIIYYVG